MANGEEAVGGPEGLTFRQGSVKLTILWKSHGTAQQSVPAPISATRPVHLNARGSAVAPATALRVSAPAFR